MHLNAASVAAKNAVIPRPSYDTWNYIYNYVPRIFRERISSCARRELYARRLRHQRDKKSAKGKYKESKIPVRKIDRWTISIRIILSFRVSIAWKIRRGGKQGETLGYDVLERILHHQYNYRDNSRCNFTRLMSSLGQEERERKIAKARNSPFLQR